MPRQRPKFFIVDFPFPDFPNAPAAVFLMKSSRVRNQEREPLKAALSLFADNNRETLRQFVFRIQHGKRMDSHAAAGSTLVARRSRKWWLSTVAVYLGSPAF